MRKILLFVALSVIAAIITALYIYLGKIDTKYAIAYGQIFGSYDINKPEFPGFILSTM